MPPQGTNIGTRRGDQAPEPTGYVLFFDTMEEAEAAFAHKAMIPKSVLTTRERNADATLHPCIELHTGFKQAQDVEQSVGGELDHWLMEFPRP